MRVRNFHFGHARASQSLSLVGFLGRERVFDEDMSASVDPKLLYSVTYLRIWRHLKAMVDVSRYGLNDAEEQL